MPAVLEEQRTEAYMDQLEKYLREWIVEGYPERAENAWIVTIPVLIALKKVWRLTGKAGGQS
jgi:hypothetical protein